MLLPYFSCHDFIRFSFIHDDKKNADYSFFAPLLLLLQTSASHGHSALLLLLLQHTSASPTGISMMLQVWLCSVW